MLHNNCHRAGNLFAMNAWRSMNVFLVPLILFYFLPSSLIALLQSLGKSKVLILLITNVSPLGII